MNNKTKYEENVKWEYSFELAKEVFDAITKGTSNGRKRVLLSLTSINVFSFPLHNKKLMSSDKLLKIFILKRLEITIPTFSQKLKNKVLNSSDTIEQLFTNNERLYIFIEGIDLYRNKELQQNLV